MAANFGLGGTEKAVILALLPTACVEQMLQNKVRYQFLFRPLTNFGGCGKKIKREKEK